MKTKILFLLHLLSIKAFSQQCPCIKTAIIGTTNSSSFIHNNIVVGMDNRTINYGESIHLYTKAHTGKLSWYKAGKLIDNTFVCPNQTTEYIVKSSLSGCPDVSAKVLISVNKTLFDDHISNDNDVIIYPNPADGYLTISADNKHIKNIEIHTLNGIKLKKFECKNDSKHGSWDISDLPTGVYVVIIEMEGNKKITKRLIKN